MGVEAFGTQAATLNTEHTLHTDTDDKTYVLTVDASSMAVGDELELRVYMKTLTGDADGKLVLAATYNNVQGDGAAPGASAAGEVVIQTPPIKSPYQITFTLKQTAGTGRSFNWHVSSP